MALGYADGFLRSLSIQALARFDKDGHKEWELKGTWMKAGSDYDVVVSGDDGIYLASTMSMRVKGITAK